jgi:hypothetical protein
MPRYFFEMYDDGHFTPDYTGVELASVEAAKKDLMGP